MGLLSRNLEKRSKAKKAEWKKETAGGERSRILAEKPKRPARKEARIQKSRARPTTGANSPFEAAFGRQAPFSCRLRFALFLVEAGAGLVRQASAR